MDPLWQTASLVLGLGFLYLVHICHQMHRRQERVEQCLMLAMRVGTFMAGSAAMGPLMSFFQMPAAPPPPHQRGRN